MNRNPLPAFLATMVLGVLLAVSCASAQDLPSAAGDAERPPIAKNTVDGPLATRSDGTVGRATPPDPNEVKKLVGYMRDGMNRADRADKERVTRRVIQYRRIWIRK